MVTESATASLPSIAVVVTYLPVRRLRPLTGRLLDEWVKPPPKPADDDLDDRWEIARDEWPAMKTAPLPRVAFDPIANSGSPGKGLPQLRIAVKKNDDIQYFIRVDDPREEVIREFNARKRHTGVHAVAMYEPEGDFRTSYEVWITDSEAKSKMVFRSWEMPAARAMCNKLKAQRVYAHMIKRKAHVNDDMDGYAKAAGFDPAIVDDVDCGNF